MALSELLLLSKRGDRVVSRDYRGDVPAGTADTFAASVASWTGSEWEDCDEASERRQAPHVFHKDGVTFFYVSAGGMYIVGTCMRDGPPSMALELLQRVQVLVRDYLGVFGETAVRRNFALVGEILDEAADFGYPQATRSDEIARSIKTEPAGYRPKLQEQPFSLPGTAASASRERSAVATTRAPPGAAQRPAISANGAKPTESSQSAALSHVPQLQRASDNADAATSEEVFVDVIERIDATFIGSSLQSAAINGGIHIRSFLSGTPRVRMALGGNALGSASIAFDERCNSSNFHADGTLSLTARRGETRAVIYRTKSNVKLPVAMHAEREQTSEYRLEVKLHLHCRYASDMMASNMQVVLPLPRGTANASAQVSSHQTATFDFSERCIRWNLGKAEGSTSHACNIAVSFTTPSASSLLDEIGPASVHFSLPKFSGTGMQVRYLQLQDASERDQPPARWVRYICESNSFTLRL